VKPPGNGQTGLIYFHGIQSHGGWFEWSASLLAQLGFTVILPDRRGSGLNADSRGDVPDRERWLADIDEIAQAEMQSRGLKLFALVGVSWGGKLAAAWARRRPELAESLLLVAPGIFPRVGIGPVATMKVATSLVLHPTGLFGIPLDDPALFTDNPDGQAFIRQDSFALTSATARFLYQSRKLERDLRDLPDGALRLPTHLLLAGKDRIIRNEPTGAWIQRVTGGRALVTTLDEEVHTFDFSLRRGDYQTYLCRWAANRLDANATFP
jgi:alpha-beta hydrolase superfamily lysophospholipase